MVAHGHSCWEKVGGFHLKDYKMTQAFNECNDDGGIIVGSSKPGKSCV